MIIKIDFLYTYEPICIGIFYILSHNGLTNANLSYFGLLRSVSFASDLRMLKTFDSYFVGLPEVDLISPAMSRLVY